MVHRAVRYAEPGDLADCLVPILDEALRRSDAVSVAVDDRCRAALTDGLGGLAADVEWVDNTRPARVDAFQLVARRAALVTEQARRGRASVFVGQNQPALGLPDDYWLRLEAAVQFAFADLPVLLLCPYPSDAPALAGVHPEIVADGVLVENPLTRAPESIVTGMPVAPLPDLGRPDVRLPVTTDTLTDMRQRLAAVLGDAGLPPGMAGDLVYAVSEVATNSIEHGPGWGAVSVWSRDGDVVCEVADSGRLDEVFPGVRPPSLDQARGRGLWLARTLCDAVDTAVDDDGTRVRLTCDRVVHEFV
jgi:anti-sigma regulatory factor (Ser/Thr protein kinase)